MKRTIGREIMLILVAPVLFIVIALVAYLISNIYASAVKGARLEVKGISEINAAVIERNIGNVKIAVRSAAYILENIDPAEENARGKCEDVIISMFENDSIYNVWLAYEPNAFDGNDESNTKDYPGAPSGRFIRSYVKGDGEIVTAPDMDETILNDEAECPWYTIPLGSGALYVDVDNEGANLYDYKVEGAEEAVYTLSVVMPVKRGESIIGCVGADVVFDTLLRVAEGYGATYGALFYPDGRLFFAPETEYSEETIETLGFSNVPKIIDAFNKKQALFLNSESSVFYDGKAFAYFLPLTDGLYVFSAITRNDALANTYVMLAAAGLIFVVILAVIASFSVFITRRISTPIGKLIESANAIATGGAEEIYAAAKAGGAIKVLSQSLNTILSQFRSNLAAEKDAVRQFAVYSYMTGFLHESKTIQEAFRATAAMFCERFGLNKATVIYINDGAALIGACYEMGYGFHPDGEDFLYYRQILPLITDKEIVFLNPYTISCHNLSFLENSSNACIVPISTGRTESGCIVLESKENKSFTAYDESAYVFIAKMLSQWLARKNREEEDEHFEELIGEMLEGLGEDLHEGQKELKEELFDEMLSVIPAAADVQSKEAVCGSTGLLGALRSLPGLEADNAVNMMGGLSDVYESTFRVMYRMLPESVQKMDEYISYSHDGTQSPDCADLNAFAIEVHGLKSGLRNIGHRQLGSIAAKLEDEAKSGNAAYCKENYTAFREQLLSFHEDAGKALESIIGGGKENGDPAALKELIKAAKSYCEGFDATSAAETLNELTKYTFSDETDRLLKCALNALDEFNYEDGLSYIESIEASLEGGGGK